MRPVTVGSGALVTVVVLAIVTESVATMVVTVSVAPGVEMVSVATGCVTEMMDRVTVTGGVAIDVETTVLVASVCVSETTTVDIDADKVRVLGTNRRHEHAEEYCCIPEHTAYVGKVSPLTGITGTRRRLSLGTGGSRVTVAAFVSVTVAVLGSVIVVVKSTRVEIVTGMKVVTSRMTVGVKVTKAVSVGITVARIVSETVLQRYSSVLATWKT